jgi:hypothetical protein
MKVSVGENSEYVKSRRLISYFTYGVFDGETFEIKNNEKINSFPHRINNHLDKF